MEKNTTSKSAKATKSQQVESTEKINLIESKITNALDCTKKALWNEYVTQTHLHPSLLIHCGGDNAVIVKLLDNDLEKFLDALDSSDYNPLSTAYFTYADGKFDCIPSTESVENLPSFNGDELALWLYQDQDALARWADDLDIEFDDDAIAMVFDSKQLYNSFKDNAFGDSEKLEKTTNIGIEPMVDNYPSNGEFVEAWNEWCDRMTAWLIDNQFVTKTDDGFTHKDYQ